MDIKPLNVLGAEVSDVDLISLSSKGSVKGIQDAIDEYKVLFFRNQNLEGEELTNLATKEKFQSLLGELREKAIDELHRTHAGFVDTMPQTAAMKKGG